MGWFTKEIETVETVIEQSPVERYEDCCKELAAAGIELKAADQALIRFFAVKKDPRVIFVNGKIYAAVNAMKNTSPEIRALEKRWTESFLAFQRKLTELAELKKAAGLIR